MYKRQPETVAIATLVYSTITFVGMALFGIDRWIERGEAFSVYFNLFSRLSVFERRDGEIGVRRPLSGLASLPPAAGTVALLAVMIGSVSFDGASAGPEWQSVVPSLQEVGNALGLAPASTLELTYGIGLVAAIGLAYLLYRLGIAGVSTVGGDMSGRALSMSFVHSLVPIALVYAAAHYVSLLVIQGQSVASLASDPLGKGSNIFGTATSTIDYGVFGQNTYWYMQVGFVVAGHVAALALAHDRALALYDRARVAVRSQYFLLGIMVIYTVLALFLLSQANAG